MSMAALDSMYRLQWHADMSKIARALGIDPSATPEDDAVDAILAAIEARKTHDAPDEHNAGHRSPDGEP